jgi:hypothetical protein
MRNSTFGTIKQHLTTSAKTPWCRNDRAWLRKNKRRSYRARHAFPGELNDYDAVTDCILVRKMSRHARLRVQFRIADLGADCFQMMDGLIERAERSDAAVKLLFDIATKHTGRLIPACELAAVIRLYDEAENGPMN